MGLTHIDSRQQRWHHNSLRRCPCYENNVDVTLAGQLYTRNTKTKEHPTNYTLKIFKHTQFYNDHIQNLI